jgi:predicted thioesterase
VSQPTEFSYRITDADTAAALGSGDVPVLGTPRVLALVEAATVTALRDRLPLERTSVGVEVTLRHSAPSRVGETVQVRASEQGTEGSRITDGSRVSFAVEVRNEDGRVVAEGTVVRAIAARSRFL